MQCVTGNDVLPTSDTMLKLRAPCQARRRGAIWIKQHEIAREHTNAQQCVTKLVPSHQRVFEEMRSPACTATKQTATRT